MDGQVADRLRLVPARRKRSGAAAAVLRRPVPAGRGGLDLLRGAILLQFPPWFPISRPGKEYILACAERAAPRRVCVEFRNRTWMTGENQKETLEFLSAHRLPYVCADEPQGYPNSIPPVLAADADETHVVFNNCYRDYAHVNAGQLAGLISPSPPEI